MTGTDDNEPAAVGTQSSPPSSPPSPATPSAATPARPGAIVQAREPTRYEIIGEHGRGGIGRVSRAFDRDLGRDVAIKELIARNHVSEARFLREAMITARLEHPGIVPVHAAGRGADGMPFYAMKLVAGRPLRELIAERKTVDERIALLHHVIAVADAMAYAHRRHIIHRDLKPSNVIVGEFGETVVIDWGLAKDLSASEESEDASLPSPSPSSDDLTKTGKVLGTPAYMAPEQARGEHVNQRVDVFAIGAMLWELCSLQRVPPTQRRERHAMLRHAGINRDLITILDKALAPSADDRYHDAGALAADLKAFKAGARISARSYSLAASLGHWTRRHRALALSITAALVLAIVGGSIYVRDIAVERDRADAAQHRATGALDALTLNHAQLLLTSDPTAALDALATYRGDDPLRARRIEAEARGRGVAVLRAKPHQANVLWSAVVPGADGEPLGAVVSLGADGTIVRTARDGTMRTLAQNASAAVWEDDRATAHLLAYVCDPEDVCLLDVVHGVPIPSAPTLRGLHPRQTTLSPSGTVLAVVGKTGLITTFDVRDPAAPRRQRAIQIEGTEVLAVFDDATIQAITKQGITIAPPTGAPTTVAIEESWQRDGDPEGHRIASGSFHGEAVALDGPPWHVTARAHLCTDRVASIRLIPHRREIAYTCTEGSVGFWFPDTGVIQPQLQLPDFASLLAVSPDGEYVIATGGKSTTYVIDLTTHVVATYLGSEARATSLMPPTATAPFVIYGDARGRIRVWPLPPRTAKIATTVQSFFQSAFFTAKSTVIAATASDALIAFSPTTGARSIRPHRGSDTHLEPARDRKTFVAYRYEDTIETWSVDDTGAPVRTHEISTQQGSVNRIRTLGDRTDFVSAGSDGRLLRWTLRDDRAPDATLLAQIAQPIDDFEIASATQTAVLVGRDGSVWLTSTSASPGRAATPLRGPGPHVQRMFAVHDSAIVYAGFANGDVLEIDTRDHRLVPILHATGAIEVVALSPGATAIAVSTALGVFHFATRPSATAAWAWRQTELPLQHHMFVDDNLLIANGRDGAVWLYAPASDRWLYLPVGKDLWSLAVNEPGDAAVSLDLQGRMIWIDLAAARARLARADR